jgi:hypothetical protein
MMVGARGPREATGAYDGNVIVACLCLIWSDPSVAVSRDRHIGKNYPRGNRGSRARLSPPRALCGLHGGLDFAGG